MSTTFASLSGVNKNGFFSDEVVLGAFVLLSRLGAAIPSSHSLPASLILSHKILSDDSDSTPYSFFLHGAGYSPRSVFEEERALLAVLSWNAWISPSDLLSACRSTRHWDMEP